MNEYKIEGRPSTIYRVVKSSVNPYVMIDRRPIDNPELSFKAKGILTYLMSRPNGWEVSVADLIKRSTDGEESVRTGLRELRDAGHMKYTKQRKSGRITGWLIEVFEVAQQSPDGDFPDVEKPDVENQGQVLSTLSSKEVSNGGDILDGIMQYQGMAEGFKSACDEFENVLGFKSLPWSDAKWQSLGKWLAGILADDPGMLRKYRDWRNGDGKYDAMRNGTIRKNPEAFKDTAYPTFLASVSMYANDKPKSKNLW